MGKEASFSLVVKKSISTSKSLWKPLLTGWFALMVVAFFVQLLLPLIAVVLQESVFFQIVLFLGIVCISFALGAVSYMYFLVLAVEQHDSMMETFADVREWILPWIGVGILIFLRSFAWLMPLGIVFLALAGQTDSILFIVIGTLVFFAGTVLAISLGPRLIFAQFILIRDGKGIKESVQLSLKQTKGYWGIIVWKSLLLMLLLFAVMIGVLMLFSVLMFSGIASLVVLPFDGIAVILKLIGIVAGFALLLLFLAAQCYFYFLPQVFFVHLWEEMKKHPMK